MALIDGISPQAAKTLIDELAAKYPPELLTSTLSAVLPIFADELAVKLKETLVGRTITVTFTDGAMKVTIG